MKLNKNELHNIAINYKDLDCGNNNKIFKIKGQGSVSTVIENNTEAFSITLSTHDKKQGFEVFIEKEAVCFYEFFSEKRELIKKIENIKDDRKIGLDKDLECRYWISLDSHNTCLRYGKGELRLLTVLAECKYSLDTTSQNPSQYDWSKEIKNIHISNEVNDTVVWRDPVTIEPPIVVLPTDDMTMEIAANSWATSPGTLTKECQALYDTVSGKSFVLNTPDFPEFTDAIEFSISNKDGWCYKKLREKAYSSKEDLESTYLRITLGVNQGNSPGVPYVMEIWPSNHHSSIHNHADADAIIRVLYGEITVNLYPMLSNYHKNPFARKLFKTGDITWLSPDLNQTHQLHNRNVSGPTCITIQCYQYGKENNFHYEYFDHINEKGEIEQFNPTSDMDFLEFKALMRQEWQGIITNQEKI